MQPMVVGSSELLDARKEFSGWFRQEAERTGAVGRGAIAVLHRRLKAAAKGGNALVSPQQLRKYYTGENFPRPGTLKQLCALLHFNPPPPQFARMIGIKAVRPSVDPLFVQLEDAWNLITDPQIRHEVVEFVRFKAGLFAPRGARIRDKKSGGGS